MKVAVIGTGMVGRSISAKLTQLGHQVVIGTRDKEKTYKQTETDIYGNSPFSVWQRENPNVELGTFNEAAKDADLLFVCTHGSVSKTALELAGYDNLKGKTVIDLSNGLVFGKVGELPKLEPVNTDSIGEQLQAAFPEANIVKTLNNIEHTVMVAPERVNGSHHFFMSGDNHDAKDEVRSLLNSFGWTNEQIIDLGGITYSRAMEMNVILWWRMYELLGTGEFNFQLMK